ATNRGRPHAVAFPADGALLAAGGDRAVWLWESATGRELSGSAIPGVGSRVLALAAPRRGGPTLLATGGWPGALGFWDARTGRPGGELGARFCCAAAVTPHGRGPVTRGVNGAGPPGGPAGPGRGRGAGPGRGGALRPAEGAPLRGRQTPALALAPDGRSAAVGFSDTLGSGGLALFDLAAGRVLWQQELDHWVTAVTFAPDGRSLVSGHTHVLG